MRAIMAYWREALCIGVVVSLGVGVFLKGRAGQEARRAQPSAAPTTLRADLDALHEEYAQRLRDVEALPSTEQERAYAEWCKDRRNATRSVYARHGEPLPSHLAARED